MRCMSMSRECLVLGASFPMNKNNKYTTHESADLFIYFFFRYRSFVRFLASVLRLRYFIRLRNALNDSSNAYKWCIHVVSHICAYNEQPPALSVCHGKSVNGKMGTNTRTTTTNRIRIAMPKPKPYRFVKRTHRLFVDCHTVWRCQPATHSDDTHRLPA